MDAEYHLRNLLARIHRDGGHYTEEHGLDKSVADAEVKVSQWLQRDDEKPVLLEAPEHMP